MSYIIGICFAACPFLCVADERLAVLCLVCAGAICAAACLWNKNYRVTVVDILATAVAAGYFAMAGGRVSPDKLYAFAALCTVWFVVRNAKNPKRIVQLILIGALLQVALCAAQVAGITMSHHSLFPFTGSFINPGPLAGFLAVTLFAYPYLWGRKNRIWLWIGLLATLAIIVWSGARAAWLAGCVGAAVCFLPRIGKRGAAMLGVAALVLCAGLYFLRPASADGRVLIWKASASMFAESPVFGNGAEAFRHGYMYHQGDYLEDKLLSEEAGLADNVAYAFSEPVRVLCEYGIAGLLLLGTFVVCLIVGSKNRFVAAGLVAWLVFGLFSYPANVYPLRLLFVILAALSAKGGRAVWTIENKKFVRVVATLGLVLLAAGATVNYLRPQRDKDPDYLYARGAQLYSEKKYAEAIPVYEQAMRLAPSSLLAVDMGVSLYAVGQVDEAEKWLKTAVNMTPAYATPAYELFDLYRREDRTAEARRWAEYIIARKPKVTNSVTLFARKQAREYLATTKPDGRPRK